MEGATHTKDKMLDFGRWLFLNNWKYFGANKWIQKINEKEYTNDEIMAFYEADKINDERLKHFWGKQ